MAVIIYGADSSTNLEHCLFYDAEMNNTLVVEIYLQTTASNQAQ